MERIPTWLGNLKRLQHLYWDPHLPSDVASEFYVCKCRMLLLKEAGGQALAACTLPACVAGLILSASSQFAEGTLPFAAARFCCSATADVLPPGLSTLTCLRSLWAETAMPLMLPTSLTNLENLQLTCKGEAASAVPREAAMGYGTHLLHEGLAAGQTGTGQFMGFLCWRAPWPM